VFVKRVVICSLGIALAALVVAPTALGHKGGKAEPRISAKASGTGYSRTVVVRLTDIDDRDPILGATVSVSGQMVKPHVMTLAPRPLSEISAGTYRGQYPFIMRGDWTLNIEVTGNKVNKASAELPVAIGSGATARSASAPTALPTRLETNITGRDYLTMLVLWVHGLAAMGWIIGVIALLIALSTEPLLVQGVRARISRAYRRWGAWVHWSSVPVIVATGIYNMVYVTPFTLRWPWSSALDKGLWGHVRGDPVRQAGALSRPARERDADARAYRSLAGSRSGAGCRARGQRRANDGADQGARLGSRRAGGPLRLNGSADPCGRDGASLRAHPQPCGGGREFSLTIGPF